MAYRIRWTSGADEDVENIKEFLESTSGKKAKQDFLAHLYEQVSHISVFPKMGKASVRKPGYREKVMLPYHILYYKIEQTTVSIASVFDTRRGFDKLNI